MDVKVTAGQVLVDYGSASKLIGTNAFKVLRKIGTTLIRIIAKEKLSAGRGAGTGWGLTRRTGNLTRALFYKVKLERNDALLTVGADGKKAAYAAIQEEGGVVRPVRSQNLTVPLEAARTANGVAKFTARQLFDNPESAGYVDAFTAKGVIFGVKQRKRKGEAVDGFGSIEALFALKKEIKIPGKHCIRDTVDERRAWILDELGASAVDAAHGKVEGGD